MAKTKIQHLLNPLHIYCRLRDLGISKQKCNKLCRLYEKHIVKKLYKED